MPDPRIVLCVPHGGLNDTLCQIEKCREYARRFGRDLYIDTRRSGLMGDFGSFFEVRPSAGVRCVTAVDHAVLDRLNAFGIHPPQLAGRLGQTKTRYNMNLKLVEDAESGVPLTFDFDADYREAVLLHQQHGGGIISQGLLKHLVLAGPLRERVGAALRNLPARYEAIHIRHSDYKTDYVQFLASLRERLVGKQVLVCSDSAEVISQARHMLPGSRIFTVTAIPDLHGKPLHVPQSYTRAEDRHEATVRSLTDLLALARASALHFTRVDKGIISGFSKLADYLNRNRRVADAMLLWPRKPQQG